MAREDEEEEGERRCNEYGAIGESFEWAKQKVHRLRSKGNGDDGGDDDEGVHSQSEVEESEEEEDGRHQVDMALSTALSKLQTKLDSSVKQRVSGLEARLSSSSRCWTPSSHTSRRRSRPPETRPPGRCGKNASAVATVLKQKSGNSPEVLQKQKSATAAALRRTSPADAGKPAVSATWGKARTAEAARSKLACRRHGLGRAARPGVGAARRAHVAARRRPRSAPAAAPVARMALARGEGGGTSEGGGPTEQESQQQVAGRRCRSRARVPGLHRGSAQSAGQQRRQRRQRRQAEASAPRAALLSRSRRRVAAPTVPQRRAARPRRRRRPNCWTTSSQQPDGVPTRRGPLYSERAISPLEIDRVETCRFL